MKYLHVGNLPLGVTPAMLRQLFGADGRRVIDVNIINDSDSGEPRGFAYVQMASDTHAESARSALDGCTFAGCTIRVSFAEESTQPPGADISDPRSP